MPKSFIPQTCSTLVSDLECGFFPEEVDRPDDNDGFDLGDLEDLVCSGFIYQGWRAYVMDLPDCDNCVIESDLPSTEFLVKSSLCYSLCRFVTEVTKKDESNFLPISVKSFISTIQM